MLRQLSPLALALALPLFAQDAPPAPPADLWTSSIGAGLALTSGNTDTRNVNVSFNTVWDPKTDRLFKADAVYLTASSDGETQVDKATANTRFERMFEERAFWFGEVQYLRDPLKEISYLISPLAGAGIHLIRDERRTLTVDGAAGGIFEENESFGRETSGAIKAGESFEWRLSEVSSFTQRLSGLWKVNDLSDALYHFDAGITTTIVSRLDLKVSLVYDYRSRTPSPDVKNGDSALFAALVFKF